MTAVSAQDASQAADDAQIESSADSGVVFGRREDPGESKLPLLKHLVPEKNWDRLPRPYGAAYFYHYQSQWYSLQSVNINGVEVPSDVLAEVKVNSLTHSHGLKADMWLFPFLNLFATASYTTGAANVYVNTNLQPQPGGVGFDVTAYAVGPGMTLAFGIGDFFLSATAAYVWVFRPNSDSSDNAALTMLFGYSFPVFNIYAGGQWSDTLKDQGGYLGSDSGVRYDVTIETESPWNFVMGMRFSLIRDRLELVYQQGFGERASSTMNLIYRWGK